MARLDLHKYPDGLRAGGPIPDDHHVSAGWIHDLIKGANAEVTVTLHLVDGPVTWRLAGMEDESGAPTPSNWHLVRDQDVVSDETEGA